MKNRMLITVLLAVVSIALPGCDKEVGTEAATWCVLLDMSGVRDNPETRQQYSQNVAKVLEKAGPGDAIIVAMITESSATEQAFIINETLPVFAPTTTNDELKKLQKRKYEASLKSRRDSLSTLLGDFILNSDRIAPTTDIISAVHVAANVFRKHDNAAKQLIILSDMEQYSNDYKFPSENLNEERIAQIVGLERDKARGIPNLAGVKVFVAGANSKNSDQFFRIQNFWIAYFDACQATLLKEDYGAALIKL